MSCISPLKNPKVCLSVYVCTCVRARASVRACVHMCMYTHMHVFIFIRLVVLS